MFKAFCLIGLAAALTLAPAVAFALSGDSSSWGSVGVGPVVPTIELTPWDRAWNVHNQARYDAEASAEWIRTHRTAPLPSPFGR